MSARRAQAGFTLLEVVIAFVILALTLVTVFQIFSSGLARASDLDEYARALVIAQSQIAAVGIEEKMEAAERSGESEDRRYRWKLSIQPYEEIPEGGTPPQSALVMYRVEAVVGWRAADGRERNVRLATLALGPKNS